MLVPAPSTHTSACARAASRWARRGGLGRGVRRVRRACVRCASGRAGSRLPPMQAGWRACCCLLQEAHQQCEADGVKCMGERPQPHRGARPHCCRVGPGQKPPHPPLPAGQPLRARVAAHAAAHPAHPPTSPAPSLPPLHARGRHQVVSSGPRLPGRWRLRAEGHSGQPHATDAAGRAHQPLPRQLVRTMRRQGCSWGRQGCTCDTAALSRARPAAAHQSRRLCGSPERAPLDGCGPPPRRPAGTAPCSSMPRT